MTNEYSNDNYLSMGSNLLYFGADSLGLGVELKGVLCTLPTQPAVLHTPERHLKVSHQPAIGPHSSNLELVSNTMPSCQV